MKIIQRLNFFKIICKRDFIFVNLYIRQAIIGYAEDVDPGKGS